MPATYKGRAEIRCDRSICIADKSRENVGPDCLPCEASWAVLIDLEAKPLGEIRKLEDPDAVAEKSAEKSKKKR